jgi:hypothetical protein
MAAHPRPGYDTGMFEACSAGSGLGQHRWDSTKEDGPDDATTGGG